MGRKRDRKIKDEVINIRNTVYFGDNIINALEKSNDIINKLERKGIEIQLGGRLRCIDMKNRWLLTNGLSKPITVDMKFDRETRTVNVTINDAEKPKKLVDRIIPISKGVSKDEAKNINLVTNDQFMATVNTIIGP